MGGSCSVMFLSCILSVLGAVAALEGKCFSTFGQKVDVLHTVNVM